ncbi:MAG: DNA-binding protein WhiA [Parasporobacterium sp.]|nr:DNA-binding protein WhiA [Parasporobacterium sp.]
MEKSSFASRVKEELIKLYTKSKDARNAEFLGIMHFNPRMLEWDSEKDLYVNKTFTSTRKTYNIKKEWAQAHFTLESLEEAVDSFDARKAFLRGAFLAAGAMSDPSKGYQLEITCPDEALAQFTKAIMESFGVTAHITLRRGREIVYIKEGEFLEDMLNIMGAHVSLMEFENVRIVKEMRGSINRKVNCETANLNKSVSASMKQTEDIQYIIDHIGLDNIDESLRDIARLRMENPQDSLQELGEKLSPPLGKSGVNHRLRKIGEIAANARKDDQHSSERIS